MKAKPGWDQVRAVAQNKVYLAPSLPWGWIDAPPSLNRLIGLRWLLKTFYPAEAGIDLPADTRAFYELFYGVKLDDTATRSAAQWRWRTLTARNAAPSF